MAAVSIRTGTPASAVAYARVKAALEAQGCTLAD